jgi:hypothetical protein
MIAKYTIVIERYIGSEDGQEGLGVGDSKSAINQLRKELQDACDSGHLEGQFLITGRQIISDSESFIDQAIKNLNTTKNV